jgi:hypothetical protein
VEAGLEVVVMEAASVGATAEAMAAVMVEVGKEVARAAVAGEVVMEGVGAVDSAVVEAAEAVEVAGGPQWEDMVEEVVVASMAVSWAVGVYRTKRMVDLSLVAAQPGV